MKNSAGQSLAISTSGQSFELRHLELSPTVASLGQGVQPVTYTSLVLDLASPQLTVVDSHRNVVHLTPQTHPFVQLAATTVSVPLNITIGGASRAGMLLDFDLQHSVTNDVNGNYIINPVITAATQQNSLALAQLQGSLATVTAVFFNGPNPLSQVPINATNPGGQQVFQAQLMDSGQVIPVSVDSTTVWDPALGQFSNLRVGQLIYLSADLQDSGSFLAKSVQIGPRTPSSRYQGVVTGVQKDQSGNVSLKLVVQN